MADFIKLSIITPEKEFYTGNIRQLDTESIEGKLGILPRHATYVAILKPTVSDFVDEKGEKKKFFSSSGVLRVKGEQITMLCDSCEWPEEIDTERAKRAKQRAEKRLKEKSNIDIDRAKLALMRSLSRLKVTEI